MESSHLASFSTKGSEDALVVSCTDQHFFVVQRINLPPAPLHEECGLFLFLLFWVHVQIVTFKARLVCNKCAVPGHDTD